MWRNSYFTFLELQRINACLVLGSILYIIVLFTHHAFIKTSIYIETCFYGFYLAKRKITYVGKDKSSHANMFGEDARLRVDRRWFDPAWPAADCVLPTVPFNINIYWWIYVYQYSKHIENFPPQKNNNSLYKDNFGTELSIPGAIHSIWYHFKELSRLQVILMINDNSSDVFHKKTYRLALAYT